MPSGSSDKGTKKSASMSVIPLVFNSWKYGRTLKLNDKRVVQYPESSIKPPVGLFISSMLMGGLIGRESLLFDREAYLI